MIAGLFLLVKVVVAKFTSNSVAFNTLQNLPQLSQETLGGTGSALLTSITIYLWAWQDHQIVAVVKE